MNQRGGRGGYGSGGFGGPANEEEYVMNKMLTKLSMSINTGCFSICINNFSDDKLSANEIACLNGCASRQAGAFSAMNDVQQILASKG